VVTDLDRLKVGGDHWQWDSSKASYVGVLPPTRRATCATRPTWPLPQIDARPEMSRHRHGYFLVVNAGRLLEAPGQSPAFPDGREPVLALPASAMNGIGHYDFEKG
jgi:hypothetical protein